MRLAIPLEYIVAEKFLSKYFGEYVSRKAGFTIVKALVGSETVIIWFRSSPVTTKALNMYDKLVKEHKFDYAMLVRLNPRKADKVELKELTNRFREIVTLEEFMKK